jgi:undecaprenyl-diphosphatase
LDALLALDTKLFRFLNGLVASPLLDQLFLAISSRWLWFVAAGIFACYAVKGRRRDLLILCVILGITIGITDLITFQVLKSAVARLRPCRALTNFRLVPIYCSGDYGFPSNHAANSMAAAVVLTAYVRRGSYRAALFATVFLIGLSRIYLGVHYPLDVLGGFCVGGLVGGLVRMLIRLFYRSPDRSKTTLGFRDTSPSTLE